jgi:hypothetical protein
MGNCRLTMASRVRLMCTPAFFQNRARLSAYNANAVIPFYKERTRSSASGIVRFDEFANMQGYTEYR